MIIALIIIAWLVDNVWLTLLLADFTPFYECDEMPLLLPCAVFNPLIVVGVRFAVKWIIEIIKKN